MTEETKKTTVAAAAEAYADACKVLDEIETANKKPPRIGVEVTYRAQNVIHHYLKQYLPQAMKSATDFAKSEVAEKWQALEEARKRETDSGGVDLKVVK